MTYRKQWLSVGVPAFLLGAALPTLVIWDPAGWRADPTAPAGEKTPAGRRHETAQQLWTCGMHPQVIQDEPGLCPICQMNLTPLNVSGVGIEAAAGGERKIKYWRAPMDPNYISDKPGKSPMGMELVPVYEDEAGAETGVRVDPSFLQNFAVRTAVAEKGSIPIEIRTVGILTHNPERLYSVNTKFTGWIEKAYFNNVGEFINKGDVLFEIYSPELVTTQQEYLAAMGYLRKLSGSSYPDAVRRAEALLEASRERLRYWDVSDEQIRELEQTGRASRRLKIFSPFSGYLVEKMADSLEGMKLTPGMTVYKLADHSKLWVEVEFFEHQIQYLRVGQSVRVEVAAFPGRAWSGRMVLLDSALNAKTRTLKAYVEVDNQDLKLRPQMFADILYRVPGVVGAVKVPAEAVIHSGRRSVVIVQKARGVFEPREVELGASGGGYQEIRSGVSAGETVVTSSQFLIDSESNLKAAISQLLSRRNAQASREGGEAQPPAAHQH